jgi:hypothetical protein
MVVLKRIAIWLGETSSEAFFLMVLLTALVWRDPNKGPLIDTLRLTFFGTLFFFMLGSGYLLTTGFFGIVWRSSIPWVYPVIAATLFVIHVQFFATGWEVETKVPVQVGGACIVFGCTFFGGLLLRKWAHTAG